MAEFKSDSNIAENESNAISMQKGGILTAAVLAINATNLPVVANMRATNDRMNACNDSYRNLLKSHADSISRLGQEFDTFDKDLSTSMELVQK